MPCQPYVASTIWIPTSIIPSDCDSLTEGWDAEVWKRTLASRGALNAGVSGDRTDHLLWRLQHGNLAGPQPKAVVLLIGTNDLAYGRSPELTADGIRANLERLRQRLPEARILLLGLLPREESPSAPLRLEVAQVNRFSATAPMASTFFMPKSAKCYSTAT